MPLKVDGIPKSIHSHLHYVLASELLTEGVDLFGGEERKDSTLSYPLLASMQNRLEWCDLVERDRWA